jgi:hypothetical protein
MPGDGEPRIGRPISMMRKQEAVVPWIWEGVVVRGGVTLLSAPVKTGKTTLLSLLLDRRRAGGRLLGRAVEAGKTLLCSEENDHLWALRQPPLDFGADLIFHRPCNDYPTRGGWKRFIEDLIDLTFQEDPFDLVVIDTAARFLPLGDRNKRVTQWAVSKLGMIADAPAGVLVLNQSRTMHRPLAAFADIVIEMEKPRGAVETRCRAIRGVGRYPGTLQGVTAELNADGTDYVLGGERPASQPPLPDTLRTLLSESPTSLTGRELLARWPSEAPRQDTLLRALARGVELGLFERTGAGTKTEPFRYGVASASGSV